MKYLVMENHPSHSVVMDETGAFHRVANLGYEIGDTVTDPVFMKSPEKKKNVNWKKVSTIVAIFICVFLAGIPLFNGNMDSDITVYMSINPEVHLELNDEGYISKVVADNEDGKVLLKDYEYRGKSVSSVLIELIDRADKLKYLSEGGDIHITIEASDNFRAKSVEVDLSEVLKKQYVKKYLIKIKANEEDFRDLDDILRDRDAEIYSETCETTLESEVMSSEYRATDVMSYTEMTSPAAESSTAGTVENTRPTQNSKPTNKPTEKPTIVTKPTEVITEAVIPVEPSSGTDVSSDDGDEDQDDEFDWPWWSIFWFLKYQR